MPCDAVKGEIDAMSAREGQGTPQTQRYLLLTLTHTCVFNNALVWCVCVRWSGVERIGFSALLFSAAWSELSGASLTALCCFLTFDV